MWLLLVRTGVELRLYGYICNSISHYKFNNVVFCGLRSKIEDVYSEIDISINPVRYGSGVKIKTLEAMAHGVPVVTTTEGARGLTTLDGNPLLVADEELSFANHIQSLMDSFEQRKQLSLNALGYINLHHSHEACFSALVEAIDHD